MAPRLVFALYDREDEEIGYSDSRGASIDREPFETVRDLITRAFSQLGSTSLFALYVGTTEPAPAPIVAPPAPAAPIDPFALAGIGTVDPRYADYSREQWG